MKPVSLKSVVNEMDVISDDVTAYINKKTGELCAVSEEEANIIFLESEGIAFVDDFTGQAS